VSLNLLGVLRGSGLSVVDEHLGTVGRCSYLVSGFIRVEQTRVVNAYGRVAIRGSNLIDCKSRSGFPGGPLIYIPDILPHSTAFSRATGDYDCQASFEQLSGIQVDGLPD
jgi:hypothetical protein